MNATTRTGLREARRVYAEAMREHDDEASRKVEMALTDMQVQG
ncbi:hypothetical protein [Sediminivirga luteola]|jgi:hypothetical protein|nr:hypothetical protein [Sediminivirga luteola]